MGQISVIVGSGPLGFGTWFCAKNVPCSSNNQWNAKTANSDMSANILFVPVRRLQNS